MDDSIVSPARIHQHRCSTVLTGDDRVPPPLRGDLPGTDTSIPWDMIFQDLNYDFAAQRSGNFMTQNCTLELTPNCRTGSKCLWELCRFTIMGIFCARANKNVNQTHGFPTLVDVVLILVVASV